MRLRVGDTGAPGLSQKQRDHLLGQCIDLNAIAWTVATIRVHLTLKGQAAPNVVEATHLREGSTSFQPLSTLADTPLLHGRVLTEFPTLRDPPRVPFPWTTKSIPKNWEHTDGSNING